MDHIGSAIWLVGWPFYVEYIMTRIRVQESKEYAAGMGLACIIIWIVVAIILY